MPPVPQDPSRPPIGARTDVASSRRAIAAYWLCTLFVTLTALAAGVMDVLHLEPLFGLLRHLGYPSYFATVLGVWKIIGGLVLLAPRHPLAKEWAYAGMFIDYSSAAISHLASGDAASAIVGAIVSAAALIASWYLRPPSRRLARDWRTL